MAKELTALQGEPLFEVIVMPLHNATYEEAEELQSLFRRLVPKFSGLLFGEVVVHVGAGKPQRILRTESEVIK